MEWESEQQDHGGLGFAGICREIYRVGLQGILPNTKGGLGAAIFSVLLLAHVTALHTLVSLLLLAHIDGDVARIVACWAAITVSETIFTCVLLLLSSLGTALYVFRVASRYRILRDLPTTPFARFFRMIKHLIILAVVYTLAMLVLLLLQLIDSDEAVVMPLQVLSGPACLVSAAYVAVVSHVACVVEMLENAALFGAMRKSRALLAGKLWAAAAVFVPLDGCFLALHVFFYVLVLEDALRLGLWFQVAAGAAVAMALWAVVVVTLVAQPVVYLVCKNHHHEVVDKVHLNYV